MNEPKQGLRARGSGLRNTLDQEIDQVAARMVSVEHDAAMAGRIVARLPEHEKRSAWPGVFLPQAAAAVAILVAVVMWTTRDRADVRTAGALAPDISVPSAPPPVAIEEAGAKAPALRRSLPLRQSEPVLFPDHERGLDPVAAPIAIELAALEAPALLQGPPLVVAPLALTELPLSGESISPQK